jgi:hypothetical protein
MTGAESAHPLAGGAPRAFQADRGAHQSMYTHTTADCGRSGAESRAHSIRFSSPPLRSFLRQFSRAFILLRNAQHERFFASAFVLDLFQSSTRHGIRG